MNLSHWLFVALLALPIAVAVFDLGALSTLFLILLWLLARWMVTLRGLLGPQISGLHLDTIGVSHFVEKVRWCLDRADIAYTEHQNVGTMGAFFTGRSVPRLRASTGLVTSSIGNSSEILRYVWGNYAHENPQQCAFLEPTADRVAFEETLDRYGSNLQVWAYFHLLQAPPALGKAWGIYDPNTPAAQRAVATIIAPLLRRLIRFSFNVNQRSVETARKYIEKLLATTEARLSESDYLVGDSRSYVDYAFAALSGPWLQPEQFGNGRVDNVRLMSDECPTGMVEDIARWRELFPVTVSFLENLYQNERSNATQAAA